jgi:hypothetical protein
VSQGCNKCVTSTVPSTPAVTGDNPNAMKGTRGVETSSADCTGDPMLQGVTRVLQGCYKDVTRFLQGGVCVSRGLHGGSLLEDDFVLG